MINADPVQVAMSCVILVSITVLGIIGGYLVGVIEEWIKEMRGGEGD